MHTRTVEGHDWLVSCLDPFHDFQQQIRGFPDVNGTISCTQLRTISATLSSPEASPASNWDALVVFTGLDGTDDGSRSSGAFGNCTNDNTATFANYDHATQNESVSDSVGRLAPVIALSKVSVGGTESTLHLTNDANTKRISLNTRSVQGEGRLIGIGMEIVNTTAEIYKQGTLCVAQCNPGFNHPGASVVNYKDINASPYATAAVGASMLQELPYSVSTVKRIPGSGTWEASKGVYVVPRMTTFSLPLTGEANNTVQYRSSVDGGKCLHVVPYQYSASIPTFRRLDRSGFAPIAVSLTGLSPQTTFTITLRTIVEYFPNEANSTLLPFAFQSPEYDPLALETYAAIVRKAPYAVPVDMNAAGDYFRMILKAANSIGGMLSVVPGTTGLVASGVKMITDPFMAWANGPAMAAKYAAMGAGKGIVVRPKSRPKEKESNALRLTKVSLKTAGARANPVRR